MTPPAGRGKGRAGAPAAPVRAKRRATLSGNLVRRPAVLATLLLGQADPAPAETTVNRPPGPPGSDADFALWLRMVLSPVEAARFRSWARANPAAGRAIRREFAQATDDDDFEALVRGARAAVAATGPPRRRRRR